MRRLIISLIAMVAMQSAIAADRLTSLPSPILGGELSNSAATSVEDIDFWHKGAPTSTCWPLTSTRSLERTAVVRITLTEPPVGKRKQYDKEGEEMKYGRME